MPSMPSRPPMPPVSSIAQLQRLRELGDFIRQQRTSAQISLRQLSAAAGVSNPYLSQIERGLRKPSAEILQQIARGLRISAEALYVQAGILDERHPATPLAQAIAADGELSERQKQVLLDIYTSFRRENADLPGDAEAPAGPGTESVSREPAEAPSAEQRPARRDAGRANPSRANPTRANPSRANASRANPSRANTTRAGTAAATVKSANNKERPDGPEATPVPETSPAAEPSGSSDG